MSTTHTPDFGEPWKNDLPDSDGPLLIFNRDMAMIFKRLPTFSKVSQLNRAIACVNALAGITDPAAAIQAARDALSNVLVMQQMGVIYKSDEKGVYDSVEQALALLTPKP